MAKILFMKYDFRKIKSLYLLSIVLFAPIGFVMAYGSGKILSAYVYMLLISTIIPTSLFTSEQRSDCGFDLMLPAKEIDRVAGRYIISAITIVYEFVVGTVVTFVLNKSMDAAGIDVFVVFKIFTGGLLMYMAIALYFFYIIGRGINQQVRSVVMMFPNMIVWGIVYALVNFFSDELLGPGGLLSDLNMFGNILLIVGIVVYVASAYLSTYVIKKKDFR